MTPERWRRIKKLFEEALELNPHERVALLESSPDADHETIQSVFRLLEQSDSAGLDFLEQPVGNAKKILRDASPQPHKPRLSEGQRLAGRFVVGEFIAHGGMGEVYRAFDTELALPVAIKTLRSEYANDKAFLDRFRHEVQTARAVRGEHLCTIYDIGREEIDEESIVYLSMEYLDGPTLREVIKAEGPLPTEIALGVLRQIASGLDSLRAANLVHRDLKPGNVVLVGWGTPGFRAVITDFGLARPALRSTESGAPGTASQTVHSGRIVGTPDYMAPEQFGTRPVTAAADVYAFGILAYEMVTGKRPFEGDGLEAAVARLSEDPVSPTYHSPALPPLWERAILRCLCRDPADRPESAAAVTGVLAGQLPERALQAEFSLARAIPKLTRWEWAAALLLALMLPLAGWFAAQNSSGGQSAQGFGKHLSVLPFSASAADPQLLAYGDGLMDTITRRLSQFERSNQQLVVVPSSEVRRQGVSSPDDALKKFNVDYVVEGRVDSQGDRVRLTLTVVDTRTMRQVDTAVVEESRAKLLDLQDGAIAKLSNALRLAAAPGKAAEVSASFRTSPDAYDFYLQGRGYLQRSDRAEDVRNAIELFRRSLEHDAGFAPSLAGLADAYWFLYERTRESKWVDEARTYARTALSANGQIADTHITMGRVLNGTGDYGEAVERFKAALEMDSRNADALDGLASAYANLKQFSLAENTYRRAVSYRPSDWYVYKKLGLYYLRIGNSEEAAEAFTHVVELTPDNAQGYNNLGAALLRLGRLEEARKNFLKTYELQPRVSAISNLAWLEFMDSRYEEALKWYSLALKQDEKSYRVWGNIAAAQARLGRRPEADESHRKAIDLVNEELKVNPRSGHLYSYLAHYQAPLGLNDAAIANMKRAVELVPNDSDLLIRNAETWMSLGNEEEARRSFRDAFRHGLVLDSIRKGSRLWPFVEEFRNSQPAEK